MSSDFQVSFHCVIVFRKQSCHGVIFPSLQEQTAALAAKAAHVVFRMSSSGMAAGETLHKLGFVTPLAAIVKVRPPKNGTGPAAGSGGQGDADKGLATEASVWNCVETALHALAAMCTASEVTLPARDAVEHQHRHNHRRRHELSLAMDTAMAFPARTPRTSPCVAPISSRPGHPATRPVASCKATHTLAALHRIPSNFDTKGVVQTVMSEVSLPSLAQLLTHEDRYLRVSAMRLLMEISARCGATPPALPPRLSCPMSPVLCCHCLALSVRCCPFPPLRASAPSLRGPASLPETRGTSAVPCRGFKAAMHVWVWFLREPFVLCWQSQDREGYPQEWGGARPSLRAG